MSEFALSQIMQAIERMVRVATVSRRQGDRVKVMWADGAESAWLKLAQLGSNEQKFWIPQNEGDQVLVLSPGGDTTQGIVYPGPFIGGAPGQNFHGDFTFQGTVQGQGDVVASDISLVEHVHKDVTPGASDTGKPK
ncbi:Phage-related baseplate assembly protein [Pelagimonas phthalicica]|uniref:Phage-related baseplate assembly protein n=1 Tax=Pelagimonas phthalicica TaxID=1037362 RepID=A0A238J995_9RHOB|nr:phage baseplate assembly protein V [Pelagimonas phthalicica]TDS94184.1 type VI secretion system (T6SS) baseplate-like injector VgrG [Pelagimonas phthalicica]SMX27291.1 Phage-related baseplate assembly protein [Pelagimonas phthalicica]